jgi:putative transposase
VKKKEKEMLFNIIHDLSTNYPVEWLCSFAGVSRGGYYKWLKRKDTVNLKQ